MSRRGRSRRDRCATWRAGYLQWTSEAKGAAEPERSAALPSVDEIVRKQSMDFFGEDVLVGTPEDVIAQIEDYRSRSPTDAPGVRNGAPGMPPHQIRAGMELFAREVIPHFRGR